MVVVYIILIVTLVVIVSGVIATFKIGLDIILPEKSANSNEQMEKNENIINLATTLSFVVTATPIFIYHNRLAKKNKVTKDNKIEETSN